jgi:hypothetical protein
MKPGDIIIWQCQKFTNIHKWKVMGVHLGAVGQEGLIEVESLTHKPGWTGEWEFHPRLFIPEVLLANLKIEQSEAAK